MERKIPKIIFLYFYVFNCRIYEQNVYYAAINLSCYYAAVMLLFKVYYANIMLLLILKVYYAAIIRIEA